MNKNKEHKLVPRLRFPEFVGKGEWRLEYLGNLANIKGRIGYRGYTVADIVEKGKGAITLSPSNFDENGKLNFEKCTYISWEKYEESPEIMLENGQTVLVKTASVGKSAYVNNLPEKTTINPQIVVLKPQNIEPHFLAYTIFHNYVQIQIKNSVGAGAIPNMSQESISKFKILLPPDKEKKEQQKIATCLSSLDEVLTAERQKLEVLKEYKKGLLQNLFPQEGEVVPKFRFKEFVGSGEWVEKKLEEIAELTSSKRVHLADYVSKGIPFFRGKEISQLKKKQIPDDVLYISNDQYNDIKEKYGVPQKGDILITAVGTLGNVYCIKNNDEFYFKDGNLIWMKNISIISDFLEVLLDFEKKKVLDSAIGSSQKALTMVALNKLEFKIPSDPKEQEKIASTLSSIDDLINAQNQKIEALQLHKKGLLQGLFPNINENEA